MLLEQMPQPGMKILASGGGRANLTNMREQAEFEEAFGRQGRFLGPAMQVMGPPRLRQFLAELGVKTVVGELSRVYPASQRAIDVQNALARRLEQLGVIVRLRCRATRLCLEDGVLAGVETATGRVNARRVVLACGGKSWPKLGGTGGGYAMAQQAGHMIVEPVPALVPLVTQERWTAEVAGVSLRGARVWIALPRQSKAGIVGDVLFTHRGVSGPAIIEQSGAVSQLLQQVETVPLRIELCAGMDASRWSAEMQSWRVSAGRRQVVGLLREHVPASLARQLCRLAGLDEQTTGTQLSAAQRQTLANLLAKLELTVTDTEGFDTAFVTRGGVRLKDVDPKTLQSRLIPGLYLAGELLDLDGPTGGFNLQWAFASGWLAGKSC